MPAFLRKTGASGLLSLYTFRRTAIVAGLVLPRLYAILDAEAAAARGADLLEVAAAMWGAGVRLLQYRDKTAAEDVVLAHGRALRAIFPVGECVLILNDRAELVREMGFDGVHLGQGDAAPNEARGWLAPGGLIGLSTHTVEQAREADAMAAVDYVAMGPVFGTENKRGAKAAVGVAGVRVARAVVGKPLVAIGGIDEGTAGVVLEAGADAVAMIGAVLRGAMAGADGLQARFAGLL